MGDPTVVGEGVRVRTVPVFTDFNGSPADPSTVKLLWRRDGGPVTVLTYGIGPDITRNGVGDYETILVPTDPGTYYARWEGDGTIEAAGEVSFVVDSAFGGTDVALPAEVNDGSQAYLTPDRLKTLPLGTDLTGKSDLDLAQLIDEAAAIVDGYCLVPLNGGANSFLGGTVTENHRWRYPLTFADTGQRRLYPNNRPITSIASLSIVVGHGAAAAIPIDSLVIDNDHGWVAVTSLAIASGSGLFSVEGWIVPIGGLDEPMAVLTYTYGRLFTEIGERTYPIDGGRKVFQTRHGCWTGDPVVVKQGGTVVDPTHYSLNRDTGRVTFLAAQADPVTVSYSHKLPRDISIATGYIVASLIGDSRWRERDADGLDRLRVNEMQLFKTKVLPTIDNLDQTVPRAAALLNGYRTMRIGTP